jgi:hypothetical protein
MGCDIHLFTERKRNINNEEKWVNVDNWKLNPYYDKNDEEERKYKLNSAYRNRNYTLFSLLADVRNYDDNKIISEPKGFPTDASEIVKKQNEYWEGDGHSHSFFTMKELYDFYEENKTVNFTGLVDQKGVKEIENGQMPSWWCKASTQEDLVYKEWDFENLTLKDFIDKLESHFKSEYYDKERDCEKFRVVFWFDN